MDSILMADKINRDQLKDRQVFSYHDTEDPVIM